MRSLVSFIKEFKNRLEYKLKDNFTRIVKKNHQDRQAGNLNHCLEEKSWGVREP